MIVFSSLLFCNFIVSISFIIVFIYHKLALFFKFKKMEQSTMEMTTISGQSINDEEELINLREKVRKQMELNERLRQSIHENERSSSLYSRMHDEADLEINRLKKEILERKQEIKDSKQQHLKVADFHKNYNDMQETYSNQIRILSEKVDSSLKKQKDEKIKVNINSINKIEDSDRSENKYLKELDELKQKILLIEETIEDKVCEINELEQNTSDLYHIVQELKDEQNFLHCEIQTNNEALKELTVEVRLLESQYEAKISQPLPEGSRGNSVFAEYDDKRILLIQKTKQLEEALRIKKISLAKSANELKNLMKQVPEEMKKNNSHEMASCDYYSILLKNLEANYTEREKNINKVLYETYTNLKGPEEYFLSYKIYQAWDKLNTARKNLNECSSKIHTIAKELYDKRMNLLDVQEAILSEDIKKDLLEAQIEEYKRAESITNYVQESTPSTSSAGTKENEANNTISGTESEKILEASKPKIQEKKGPKFTYKIRKINLSDFD